MSVHGNQIILMDMGHHEEYRAAAALKPGHLIQLTSDTEVQKHASAGAIGEKMFAKEDALQGKTIDDAYAAGDLVSCHVCLPGCRLQARVAAGAVAIVEGDWLGSAGDGTLRKVTPAPELLYSAVADSAEHENTTDAADFDKSYTFAANSLQVGDVIEVEGQVNVVDNNGTDTLTLLLTLGGVTLATTGAVNVEDNDVGYFKASIVVRSLGATGAIQAAGVQSLGVPGTVTAKPFKTATTVDTTAALKVAINADWSAEHADNEAALTMLNVSIRRFGSLAGSGGSGAGVIAQALSDLDNSAGSAEEFIRIRVA